MLILSRKRNEKIVIDPSACHPDENGLIVLTIVELRADKCRLGIEAPANVQVDREEVFNAKRGPKPPREAA